MEDHKKTWNVLSKVDCSKQIEKKGNLKYLSWAWAWGIAMEHFPDTSFEVKYFADPSHDTKHYPFQIHPDGTATVWMELSINGIRRTMWLPVMDNRNNSIKNPSSRQVSDTTMRCLVKGLALFGLGHYIYAGEDLPEAPASEPVETNRPPENQTPRKPDTGSAHPLIQLIEEHKLTDKVVTNFFNERKWINQGKQKGQSWTEASKEKLDEVYGRAKKNPKGFVEAIAA